MTSRKQKDSRVKEILVDGSPIIDVNQLSEYFNDHFANTGPKLAENIPTIENLSHLDFLSTSLNNRFDGDKFQLKQTNPAKVFSLLSKLCKTKATGLDGISARLLRACSR